jgi:hypothetical protein
MASDDEVSFMPALNDDELTRTFEKLKRSTEKLKKAQSNMTGSFGGYMAKNTLNEQKEREEREFERRHKAFIDKQFEELRLDTRTLSDPFGREMEDFEIQRRRAERDYRIHKERDYFMRMAGDESASGFSADPFSGFSSSGPGYFSTFAPPVREPVIGPGNMLTPQLDGSLEVKDLYGNTTLLKPGTRGKGMVNGQEVDFTWTGRDMQFDKPISGMAGIHLGQPNEIGYPNFIEKKAIDHLRHNRDGKINLKSLSEAVQALFEAVEKQFNPQSHLPQWKQLKALVEIALDRISSKHLNQIGLIPAYDKLQGLMSQKVLELSE